MTSQQNIAVLIPARGGSKGIPKKNVIDFCGKPLLAWSIEQARNAELVTEVFVSSDDNEILRIAGEHGASCIERPQEHATDQAGLEGVFEHALEVIEGKQNRAVDMMICLQPTSPLRRENDIDNAIKHFDAEQADSLFSACKLADACIWKHAAGQWESITYDYQNRGRRQDRDPLYLENGSIYIFKPAVLAEHKNRLGGKIAIYEMPFWASFEIDDKDELLLCEFNMKKHILMG